VLLDSAMSAGFTLLSAVGAVDWGRGEGTPRADLGVPLLGGTVVFEVDIMTFRLRSYSVAGSRRISTPTAHIDAGSGKLVI
jgi:hypothetical protein